MNDDARATAPVTIDPKAIAVIYVSLAAVEVRTALALVPSLRRHRLRQRERDERCRDLHADGPVRDAHNPGRVQEVEADPGRHDGRDWNSEQDLQPHR
jgi:hypothetical protein